MKQKTNQNTLFPSHKIYQTAMYLRISRDDGDKAESDSIFNQRRILQEYVRAKPEFRMVGEYVDDGYSGATFDRPAFRQLYEDLENGTVNCILVKDLSRFGRNYIEVGRYLERIFPAMGIRLVAINDHYDTADEWQNAEALLLPIRNLMNDLYCRDISVKIKTQLDIRRRRGECVSNYAPYGYQKDPANKSRLMVDEPAARQVRLIFQWKLEGMSNRAIARQLNAIGILSPLEYRLKKGENFTANFKQRPQAEWSAGTVCRILHNETYTGNLMQGKWQTLDYHAKKSIPLPQEQWIRAEHTHEAIIPLSYFYMVQDLMKKNSRSMRGSNRVELFSGFLFCGICGRQLVLQKKLCKRTHYNRRNSLFYSCPECRKNGKTPQRISVQDIYSHTLTTIQNISTHITTTQKFPKQMSLNYHIATPNKKTEGLQKELERFESLQAGLHDNYSNGLLTHEEYLEYTQRYETIIKRKQALLQHISAETENTSTRTASENLFPLFHKYENITTLTRPILAELISKIILQENGTLIILFRTKDNIFNIMNMIDKNTQGGETDAE